MTTGCFQVSFSFCATMRAKKSVAPPGGCPERKRTGLDGYAWANAALPCARSPHTMSALTIAALDRDAGSNPFSPRDEICIVTRSSRPPHYALVTHFVELAAFTHRRRRCASLRAKGRFEMSDSANAQHGKLVVICTM